MAETNFDGLNASLMPEFGSDLSLTSVWTHSGSSEIIDQNISLAGGWYYWNGYAAGFRIVSPLPTGVTYGIGGYVPVDLLGFGSFVRIKAGTYSLRYNGMVDKSVLTLSKVN